MIVTAAFAGGIAAGAVSSGARTIAGVAVPYGVEGRVADGTVVVFEPGSLDPAARPVVLRDHDRTRPLGRVVDAVDYGDRMEATARISATRDGDDALVLAADGALPMFSVGVDPTDHYVDDAGRLHVLAGDWRELSLLTIGAFDAARVDRVTASQGAPMTMTDTDPTTPEDPDVEEETTEEETTETPEVETRARSIPIVAAAARTRNPYAGLTLAALATQIAAARGGDQRATRFVAAALQAQGPVHAGITAALEDITLVGTNNVNLAHRPGYQAELVEIIGWGTPLIDALRQGDLQRGDYPTKAFNRWGLTPEVALQAAEKEEIHSVPVSIVPASATVNTWAGGNDISQQTLDLGSPSFVEDYIRAAAMDYAKKSDTYAVTTLLTAAQAVTTLATDSFIAIVGKLVGALSPATTPPGGLFLAMSYDVGVGLIGVPRDEGPAFWDGNVSFGSFTPTMTTGGLSAFVDPNMPARTYLLGHRQGATWYDLPGTPFNLRAVNVGLLGLDVAVYGYGALGIQYPGAFAKTTVPVPAP